MRKLATVLMAFALLITGRVAWAQATVSGSVYEQDSISPIAGAVVTFSGITELSDTLVFQFVTDSLGCYNDSLLAGSYRVWASAEGYETVYLPDSLQIIDEQELIGIDFVMHEIYYPVRYVAARQLTNDWVRLTWSMNDPLLFEGLETGDFSRFNWNNTLSSYPWAIDSTHAYEGDFCMKSACEGEGGGVSQIEVSVFVPLEGQMSFYSKISSESLWDKGIFYLDGVKKWNVQARRNGRSINLILPLANMYSVGIMSKTPLLMSVTIAFTWTAFGFMWKTAQRVLSCTNVRSSIMICSAAVSRKNHCFWPHI